MKRDMDLIRKILLEVESWPAEGGDRSFSTLESSAEEIIYNSYQCYKSRLVEGVVFDSSDGLDCVILRLTPEGHDFLDNARNEFIWVEVMQMAKEKGIGSASIELFKKMLNKQLKKHLDLD